MSIPKKPRTHAQAPSEGARSRPGVGPRLALAMALGFGLASCSDEAERTDQYYGTDVGAGYHLPDAATIDASTTPETAAPASDAGAAAGPDAAVVTPDASSEEPADAATDGGEATPG